MWALGVILYIFLFNKYPFDDSYSAYNWPLSIPSNGYDPETIQLLNNLLTKNPVQRISIDKFRVHKAFRNTNQNTLNLLAGLIENSVHNQSIT